MERYDLTEVGSITLINRLTDIVGAGNPDPSSTEETLI